jgi:hypothetical protein
MAKWLKLHFCRINQFKYTVMSFAVLWQHVVCLVNSVQSQAAQHTVHTPQPETHHMLPQHCKTYKDVELFH